MKYRVFWTPGAQERLDEFLDVADDPLLISIAAKEIDRFLIDKPTQLGESRGDDTRVGFAWPLAVRYEIQEDVATVIVYEVWRIG